MRPPVVLLLFLACVAGASGCRRRAAPPPNVPAAIAPAAPAKVGVTMPKGWRPLAGVTEPSDIILLGAWEHPDFPSLIKVKISATAFGEDVIDAALKAATDRIGQGRTLKNQHHLPNAVILYFDAKREDGSVYLNEEMVFFQTNEGIILFMGMWPSDQDENCSNALGETILSIHEK